MKKYLFLFSFLAFSASVSAQIDTVMLYANPRFVPRTQRADGSQIPPEEVRRIVEILNNQDKTIAGQMVKNDILLVVGTLPSSGNPTTYRNRLFCENNQSAYANGFVTNTGTVVRFAQPVDLSNYASKSELLQGVNLAVTNANDYTDSKTAKAVTAGAGVSVDSSTGKYIVSATATPVTVSGGSQSIDVNGTTIDINEIRIQDSVGVPTHNPDTDGGARFVLGKSKGYLYTWESDGQSWTTLKDATFNNTANNTAFNNLYNSDIALNRRADSLKNAVNAINTNVVRLLDVGTFYVSTSANPAIATMGDEFKPYASPWAARDAAAIAIRDGVISSATIVVKKGEYSVGVTGSGATYTRSFLNSNTFALDTNAYYNSSANSVSLVANKLNYEFRDGAQLGSKGGSPDGFLNTYRADTCSFQSNSTSFFLLEKTYNQNTAPQGWYTMAANDSAQISIIAPNATYANSRGYQGWYAKKYLNLNFNRVMVNRSRGVLLATPRFTGFKPSFFRVKANLWTDTTAKYISGFPTNTAPNDASLLNNYIITGADLRFDIGTAEVSSGAVVLRGGSTAYGGNQRAVDSSTLVFNIDNIYQYRQFGGTGVAMLTVMDSIKKSDIFFNIKKGVTEGGFFKSSAWNGLQLTNSKVKFNCENCRYQPSPYYTNSNGTAAFDIWGTQSDSTSTITIEGNYVVDSAKVIVITGSAPVNIIIKGSFVSRGGQPIIENNNVNARVMVLAGTSFVTNGNVGITGTAGAKIYFQTGADYNGTVSNVTVLTTKPAWNF